MKTWTSKLISGVVVTLLLVVLVQEKSLAQFQMGNTLAPLTGNSYPIIFTNDSKGGHHQVATIADRDNITTLRRQPGMLCTVMDDGSGNHKTYQLICADTKADRDNNANWVVFASTGENTTTPSGNSWLYGTVDPLVATGKIGDFYLNTTNNTVFGPKKADNTWPALQLQGTLTGAAGGDLSGNYPNPAIAEKVISTAKLADGAVTVDKLAVGAVTTEKINDGAVTEAKIGTAAVTADKLAANAVTTEKVNDGAVSTGKIADGSVTTVKLGEKAVTTINIADQAVGAAQLKVGLPDQVLVTNTAGTSAVWINKTEFLSAVDDVTLTGAGTIANPFKVKDLGILTAHLAEAAVTEAKLATDAVTTLKVKNMAITEEKLADGAVGTLKIKDDAVTENKLIKGAVTEAKIGTGAVTTDKLAANAVTTEKINDGAITEAKIGTAAVTADKLAANAVTTEKISDGAISTGKIADASVTTVKLGEKAITTINIADQAVGAAQLKAGLPDQVLVTNTAGTSAVWINKTEFLSAVDDVTLTGAGTIANPFKVKDLGILTAHLAEGAVTETKLATDAVTTLKVKNAAITEEKLADDAVGTLKIKDGAITETKLTNGAVTADKLALNAVTTEKINDGAISTDKIADVSITTVKLGEKAVKTGNIADKSITPFQMLAGGPNMVLVTDASGGSVIWIDKSALAAVVDMETIDGSGTVGNAFKVKDLGIITKKIADLAVTTEKIADLAVSSSKMVDKAITTEKIADKAVTVAQIKEGAANQILTTNAEGTVAWADNTAGTGSSTTFNGSRAITGDYYKGVNPNTNDIAKWLEAVFYPSTAPTVSIVPTPSLGTKEMASAGTSTVSLKWTANRVAGTAEIKQVTVDGVVVSTTSPAENSSITGTTTGTVTNNNSKSFTVVATTADGKTASASASVSFQWKIYYGFISGGDDGVAFNPTDAQIIALSGADLATSRLLKKQVTPSGSQKLVIAYPSSWGDAAILAGVNDSTGAFDKTTRSFTNSSGGTVSYLIYVQKDNTAAGYQVTVQ